MVKEAEVDVEEVSPVDVVGGLAEDLPGATRMGDEEEDSSLSKEGFTLVNTMVGVEEVDGEAEVEVEA